MRRRHSSATAWLIFPPRFMTWTKRRQCGTSSGVRSRRVASILAGVVMQEVYGETLGEIVPTWGNVGGRFPPLCN